MKYLCNLIMFATIFFAGCSETSSKKEETINQLDSSNYDHNTMESDPTTTNTTTTTTTTTTTVDTASSISTQQISGIAIKNVEEENVHFFILDDMMKNEELMLAPNESNEYKIKKLQSIIKIKGQVEGWQVEKQKRYVFMKIDSKWVLNELEL